MRLLLWRKHQLYDRTTSARLIVYDIIKSSKGSESMILWKCELCTTNSMQARHEISGILKNNHLEFKLKLADQSTGIGNGKVSYNLLHDDVPHKNLFIAFM